MHSLSFFLPAASVAPASRVPVRAVSISVVELVLAASVEPASAPECPPMSVSVATTGAGPSVA